MSDKTDPKEEGNRFCETEALKSRYLVLKQELSALVQLQPAVLLALDVASTIFPQMSPLTGSQKTVSSYVPV